MRKSLEHCVQGFLAGEEGLEPPLTVLETAALPLYYSPRNNIDLHQRIAL